MHITLGDLDGYYKYSQLPNVDCMKLSSYFKQQGYSINFVLRPEEITLQADEIYIFRSSKLTPLPNRKLLDAVNTHLIGNGGEFYQPEQISAVVAACRPDYTLYPTPQRDAYANANIIQFYHNKTLLPRHQDYHNTKQYHKKTLVIDDYFWQAPNAEIIYCLEQLKSEKNIAFSSSISLSKILNNTNIRTKFLELHFSTGTVFKGRNDYSSESVTPIIEFMLELRQRTHSKLGFIPIKGIMRNHFEDVTELHLDLLRCFAAAFQCKANKVDFIIITGKKPSPYRGVFELLQNGSTHSRELSFIEYVTRPITLQQGLPGYTILNNPIKGQNKEIDLLLYY